MHARVAVESVSGASPVVLVHGVAVSHRYLMPTAALLSSAGFDVYVVDLPGFGLSGDPGRVLDVGEHADAVAGWLDANQLGPAVLLGNSFGCQVIVDLAVRQPRRCTALVLSGLTIDPLARSATRQIIRALRDWLHEDPVQLPIQLRDIYDAGLARVWFSLRAALRDPVADKLPQLTVPTLVLRGEVEPIVPQRWARESANLVPGAELAVVPAGPHNCVYVAAEGLVALVGPFLRRALRPPTIDQGRVAGGSGASQQPVEGGGPRPA